MSIVDEGYLESFHFIVQRQIRLRRDTWGSKQQNWSGERPDDSSGLVAQSHTPRYSYGLLLANEEKFCSRSHPGAEHLFGLWSPGRG